MSERFGNGGTGDPPMPSCFGNGGTGDPPIATCFGNGGTGDPPIASTFGEFCAAEALAAAKLWRSVIPVSTTSKARTNSKK